MMMNSELMNMLSQFGPAGLMGMLWLLERRHAAIREKHLSEAHRLIIDRDRDIDALLNVVRDNTRAMTSLEQAQQQMIRTLDRLNDRLRVQSMPAARPAGAA